MSFLLSLALATYFMSGALSLANSLRRGERDVPLFRWPSLASLGVAAVANLLWILWRWQLLGHPPFADLYGCFVLLALCVGLVSLTLELSAGVRFLGGVSSLGAAVMLVVSARFIGEAHPLPPALQSAWFAPHVVAYFIAYGALSVSGLASLILLFAGRGTPRLSCAPADDATTPVSPNGAGKPHLKMGPGPIFAGAESWAWRSAQIGFPFLTLGLVLGALWAQQAYADYWSWDPKEVWALITWLLVAAWFHLRTTGRRGRLVAALMIVAVAAMYFTLFGVNFLPTAPQSLHTYTQR